MRAIQALDKPVLQCRSPATRPERLQAAARWASPAPRPNQNTDLAKQNQAREIPVILPGLSLALEP